MSIRAAIDRIEAANVIVYVRIAMFRQVNLEGRVGMIAHVNGRRFLAIELACGRPEVTTMATLGHELHHAVEIAGEPSIGTDWKSGATMYIAGSQIGRVTFDDSKMGAGLNRCDEGRNQAGQRLGDCHRLFTAHQQPDDQACQRT